MKTLYIIGNGFDIAHGIKSRYADFRDFVRTADSTLYQSLEELFDPNSLWSDFERALAEIDTDSIIDHATNYLESYAAEDWSDAYHHNYQYEIEQKIQLVTVDLLALFRRWILGLQIPSNHGNEILKLDQDGLFLTFNYTSTLETLYRIPLSRINYIHNKAIDEHSKLVLGHGVVPTPAPAGAEDDDPRVQEGEEIIAQYFRDTYKPTLQVIAGHQSFFAGLHDVKDVYVLGHSISDIDWAYFKEILNHIEGSKVVWHVSFYSPSERLKHIESLTSLGVPLANLDLRPLTSM